MSDYTRDDVVMLRRVAADYRTTANDLPTEAAMSQVLVDADALLALADRIERRLSDAPPPIPCLDVPDPD